MLTDPIADMLTRIRNANKALHEKAVMPTSRMKVEIARLLKEEGYIQDYHVEKGETFDTLVVELKFGRNRERVITGLKRISKPGRRVYARKDRLPRVLGGMGAAILSTSTGLDHEPDRAGAGHRRRGHLLHLVSDMSRIGRKPIELPSRRQRRRSPLGAFRSTGPLGELAAGVRSACRSSRARATSSSRGRPSAARTARCTG